MMEPNNDNNNVLLLLAAITQHQQISLLEILFSINQDPSAEALESIAQRINSTSQNVASWFENRRQQLQAQQAAAAAAAISAGGNHLSLVLNNLMLDPQQLQQHLQQQQNSNHLNSNNHHHHHHQNSNNTNQQLHSALLDCIAAAPSNLTGNINNNSQYYYDYQLSNASSSPTTNHQQPIQLGALNATRNSVDSPPDHIQNNSSNHNHHHHHHHNSHQIQDNSQASSTLLAKLTAVTSNLASSQSVAGAVPPPTHNHVLAGNGNIKLDSKMIDLLEALYAINDNPEMAAIEMISKRVDVPCHLISDWFDKKRMKLNPFAGHRSPPVNKKREGGRVVTFSEYQRSLLEAIFNENNYLHPQEYEELSKLIQVPSRNIKIWFKNRRSKQRLSSGARTNSVRCDNDPIEQEQQLNLHQHHHQ